MKPGRREALTQLLDIQRTVYNTVLASETTPNAVAQLARAWCELEERKRILRMKPKPKDVDVYKLKREATAAAMFAGPSYCETSDPAADT